MTNAHTPLLNRAAAFCRTKQELARQENQGLGKALELLAPVKLKFKDLTYAGVSCQSPILRAVLLRCSSPRPAHTSLIGCNLPMSQPRRVLCGLSLPPSLFAPTWGFRIAGRVRGRPLLDMVDGDSNEVGFTALSPRLGQCLLVPRDGLPFPRWNAILGSRQERMWTIMGSLFRSTCSPLLYWAPSPLGPKGKG